MDTSKNSASEILDFASFIKEFFPLFQIDGNNAKIIANLGLWANRNEKFNNVEQGWHIDRGILLSGPVGVGKDELFRLLRKYLAYLRSPYGYGFKVVWEFAKPFQEDGYACFREDNGNIYYEELGLTDEVSGLPTREYVNHFGTKILIGSEIINLRYKIFKNTAYQTHFSTNLDEKELEKIYGSRCMSRLYEMCNVMFLTGKDRRGHVVPDFLNNKITPKVVARRETTVQEHEENYIALEQHYQDFLADKEPSTSLALVYNLLWVYNVQVATEKELQDLVDFYQTTVVSGNVSLSRMSPREREEEVKLKVQEEVKIAAVIKFFNRLNVSGAKSIFGERNVSQDLKKSTEQIGK